MIKIGEHITLDFFGVKKDYQPSFYEKIIYTIAKAAKVEILNVSSHKFEPQGYTGFYLLAESHLSFHTWPEKGIISIDLYTCGDIDKAFNATQYIITIFNRICYFDFNMIYISTFIIKLSSEIDLNDIRRISTCN